MPDTVAADGIQPVDIPLQQTQGRRLQPEVQPLLIANATPDAGGIIDKAFLVKHPDKPLGQVIPAPVRVKDTTVPVGAKLHSDGIDGKVAADKVIADGTGLYRG